MMVLLQEVCKMQNFEALEAVTGALRSNWRYRRIPI